MKRSLTEKYQSTKLHQAWAIGISATLLLLLKIITPEIWLGAIAIASGQYTWANVQQHKIYGNGVSRGVDDP